jgi:hypothetical protein
MMNLELTIPGSDTEWLHEASSWLKQFGSVEILEIDYDKHTYIKIKGSPHQLKAIVDAYERDIVEDYSMIFWRPKKISKGEMALSERNAG